VQAMLELLRKQQLQEQQNQEIKMAAKLLVNQAFLDERQQQKYKVCKNIFFCNMVLIFEALKCILT
jgi:hypothetical protein